MLASVDLELALREQGTDYVIGTVGTLFVTIVRGSPRMELLEAIDRTEGAFLRSVKRPIRTLFVIRDITITRPPDGAFRERSTELMHRYGPHLAGTAQVVEGSGLKASMIRGFVTAVTLVSKQPAPTRVFPDVQTAVTWLAATGDGDALLEREADAICSEIAALETGS